MTVLMILTSPAMPFHRFDSFDCFGRKEPVKVLARLLMPGSSSACFDSFACFALVLSPFMTVLTGFSPGREALSDSFDRFKRGL